MGELDDFHRSGDEGRILKQLARDLNYFLDVEHGLDTPGRYQVKRHRERLFLGEVQEKTALGGS